MSCLKKDIFLTNRLISNMASSFRFLIQINCFKAQILGLNRIQRQYGPERSAAFLPNSHANPVWRTPSTLLPLPPSFWSKALLPLIQAATLMNLATPTNPFNQYPSYYRYGSSPDKSVIDGLFVTVLTVALKVISQMRRRRMPSNLPRQKSTKDDQAKY